MSGKNILNTKIGILGGGQLARMLAIAAAEMGFEIHILSAHASDPAAQVVRHWHCGDTNSSSDLIKFFNSVDVVTVESEFISSELLTAAVKTTNTPVWPSPMHLGIFSDRSSQKSWLKQNKIPTAPFIQPRNRNDIEKFLVQNRRGIVIKKRRFGYDGYGTFLIRKKPHLDEWFDKYENQITDFIVEELMPFKRELACQFVMSQNGQAMRFPLIEWQAENAKCLWVKGPIKHKSAKKLTDQIAKTLSIEKFVGAIAFEIFEVQGKLIVNEVAPRVHNSGHYSIESLNISQFSSHIRAIAGVALPAEAAPYTKGFAMYNIIGPINGNLNLTNLPICHWHWYGKEELRSGRKMGHITVLESTPDKALNTAHKIYKNVMISKKKN